MDAFEGALIGFVIGAFFVWFIWPKLIWPRLKERWINEEHRGPGRPPGSKNKEKVKE